MQVEREIDEAGRVVILRVTGVIEDRDLLSLPEELEKPPQVPLDFSLLIDLRKAHGTKVSSAGVRALVARPMVLSSTSRRAVVVPNDLGFGMARMYESLRQDRGGAVRPFRDYDDARRWLAEDES